MQQGLQLLLPHRAESDLQQALAVTRGDVSSALDLLAFVNHLTPARIAKPPQASTAKRPPDRVMPHSAVLAPELYTDMATPRECRAMATEYRARRNDAFRAAARQFQAHKNHKDGSRGVAVVWAERGREYDERAKTWEMRAARALVTARQTGAAGGRQTVDLHNLTVHQALTVTREVRSSANALSLPFANPGS